MIESFPKQFLAAVYTILVKKKKRRNQLGNCYSKEGGSKGGVTVILRDVWGERITRHGPWEAVTELRDF